MVGEQISKRTGIVRVRLRGDRVDLWHLMLDGDGRPERLQVRLASRQRARNNLRNDPGCENCPRNARKTENSDTQ